MVTEIIDKVGRATNAEGVPLTDEEIISSSISAIGLDSLDFLELVFELEEKYDIELEEVSVTAFPTLGSVAAVINNKVNP